MEPKGQRRHRVRTPGNTASIAHSRLSCIRKSHVSYHGCTGCSKSRPWKWDSAGATDVPPSRTNERARKGPSGEQHQQVKTELIDQRCGDPVGSGGGGGAWSSVALAPLFKEGSSAGTSFLTRSVFTSTF